jgi:SIR2-like domain
MDYDTLVEFVQGHFTDGLAFVIGSGLSYAEGIPGMPALAAHLESESGSIPAKDSALWAHIHEILEMGGGLEAALLKYPPSDSLEVWIARETARLLIPKEREVISAVFRGDQTLRLTKLLAKVLKPSTGLPILTPNYDRLIEVACEIAGFHVDTTAIGHYAGMFDHERSVMASCKGIVHRAKITALDHFPRAMVLKPHGSFDWYRIGNDARYCSVELDAERLIITPGLNKYRAGYNSPFDKHRDLANDHLKRASRLLIVGYGFNDDHLQTHLMRRIQDGAPTLILNRDLNETVSKLAIESPRCLCLSKPPLGGGIVAIMKDQQLEKLGMDLWDLGVLAEELLA